MPTYDYVFITHLPSFYKTNLYEALAEKHKIYGIFISGSSVQREHDFSKTSHKFAYSIINLGKLEKRNRLISLFRLTIILSSIRFKRIVIGGWDLPEFFIPMLISNKDKIAVAIESTLAESRRNPILDLYKSSHLSTTSLAFASGDPHKKLLETLNYKGRIIKTGGVGLINTPPKAKTSHRRSSNPTSFLYIGRLSPEKNLTSLIDAFTSFPHLTLQIAGSGPEDKKLQSQAPSNVQFLGHVPNTKITQLFNDSYYFILPSTKEPWGLVVDEALYHGTPVLLSDRCGSRELIDNKTNGYTFKPDTESIRILLEKVTRRPIKTNPEELHKAIEQKDRNQVAAYTKQCRSNYPVI